MIDICFVTIALLHNCSVKTPPYYCYLK